MLERLAPQSTNRFMIVRGVSRHGKPFIFVSGNDHAIAPFPLRNLKSGYAERCQVGSHIIRHNAKVFAYHPPAASFLQDNTQVFFALTFVCFAILGCLVVTRNEMRSAAASLLEHLVMIEWKKLFVHPWPPRESIDAIKSLDVIDPKKMKDAADSTHSVAPPLKIVRAHFVPAIERNTPVLAPFLGERVVFEVRLGRRATEPLEHEFIRARENVDAAIADAEWNIAHQCHAPFLGVQFDGAPLLLCDPLHVTEETFAVSQRCLSIVRQVAQPRARCFDCLMLRWPSIPCRAILVRLHQDSKKRVIAHPR